MSGHSPFRNVLGSLKIKPVNPPILHILCGKIASGKSTLAIRLNAAPRTVFVSEDEWLNALFAEELDMLEDYRRCSSKLRDVMGRHLFALLDIGVSIVLGFAANTAGQRAWMKGIVNSTKAVHQLHVLDVPDDVCLVRLRAHNAAGHHPFAVTEEQFYEFTGRFVAPSLGEDFNIVVHRDTSDFDTGTGR